MQSILVDAGPLIAIFKKSDRFHKKILAFFKSHQAPAVTTWPVVTEVCHFLGSAEKTAFLTWIKLGGASVHPMSVADLDALIDLLNKYRDLPMDFADASLVWLADKTGIADILTLDRKDFSVYRLSNGKSFRQVL